MNQTACAPVRSPNHARIVVALMLLIIMGPMLFAWVLFYKGNLQQLRLSHHGDLIKPVININSVVFHDPVQKISFKGKALKGKWWLIYVAPTRCYQDCQNTLYNMQQIRLALGKNTSKVERLYISNPYCPISTCEQTASQSFAQMKRANLEKAEFDGLFGMSNNAGEDTQGDLYILDPQGNLMMYYPGNKEARDILSDIKRLVKISKIG